MTSSLLQYLIRLKPYLHIAIANMENVTLIEHKEFVKKCEEKTNIMPSWMFTMHQRKKRKKKKKGELHLFQKNRSQ